MSNRPIAIKMKDMVPANPLSLLTLANKYLLFLAAKNYSPATVVHAMYFLKGFLHWCYHCEIFSISGVTRDTIEKFLRHLLNKRHRRTGEPIAVKTRRGYIMQLCSFFRWATKHNYLLVDPTSAVVLPPIGSRLPRYVFSSEEIETLLNQPNCATERGFRDRTILELFYCSGIRREEMTKLVLDDVDLAMGVLSIKEGKGRTDRYVPINHRTREWLEKYIYQIRPLLLKKPTQVALFITQYGTPFTPGSLSLMIRGYIREAGIDKPGACHIFRHAMATGMLENGADVRYIQEMLGHARIISTQVYTNVSIRDLKRVHARTHPANLPVDEGESSV